MSLVFSVNVYLQDLKLIAVGLIQPSISVSIANKGMNVLWKSDGKVQDGDDLNIDKAYQLMLTSDVFKAIDQWKIRFSLTMAFDQVSLGTATFDFKPLVAGALQNYGSSSCVPLIANFHEPIKNTVIACLNLKAKVLYHPGTEHQSPVEIFMVQHIESPPPQENLYSLRLNKDEPTFVESQEEDIREITLSSKIKESSPDDTLKGSQDISHMSTESTAELLAGHSGFDEASKDTNYRKLQAQLNLSKQLAVIPSASAQNLRTTLNKEHTRSKFTSANEEEGNNDFISSSSLKRSKTVITTDLVDDFVDS